MSQEKIKEHSKERVIAYIDGFNFYFGMLEAGHEK
ncbi:NYN domain-containing protein [bacterium]|nr:NYN domain-containing protein [bacterium]